MPALPHPLCLVAALADSPVAWSRRELYLNNNQLVSVAGVSWPPTLEYVSPLACSERQSTHCLVAALADSPVAWSRRRLGVGYNQIVSVAGVTWPSNLQYVSPLACSERQSTHARAAAPRLPCRRAG
jgi:hypothetical protein